MRLELRDVRYVYAPGTPFEVEALRGVSLVVEPGEVLGIVGGTGSGKSTLVQHMNLLLTPTSGEVLVDGVDATTLKKSELRRRVGLVFQFPESALFAATVEEDVAFAPRQLALDEKEVRERVLESLRVLGAGELAERSPFALSGGEKRRAAIAGVLAMRPEILVLDDVLEAVADGGLVDDDLLTIGIGELEQELLQEGGEHRVEAPRADVLHPVVQPGGGLGDRQHALVCEAEARAVGGDERLVLRE